MKKIYLVRSRKDGRAEIGKVSFNVDALDLNSLPVVEKKFGEDADPHHPNVPILLEILEGAHTITVAGNGKSSSQLRLRRAI